MRYYLLFFLQAMLTIVGDGLLAQTVPGNKGFDFPAARGNAMNPYLIDPNDRRTGILQDDPQRDLLLQNSEYNIIDLRIKNLDANEFMKGLGIRLDRLAPRPQPAVEGLNLGVLNKADRFGYDEEHVFPLKSDKSDPSDPKFGYYARELPVLGRNFTMGDFRAAIRRALPKLANSDFREVHNPVLVKIDSKNEEQIIGLSSAQPRGRYYENIHYIIAFIKDSDGLHYTPLLDASYGASGDKVNLSTFDDFPDDFRAYRDALIERIDHEIAVGLSIIEVQLKLR